MNILVQATCPITHPTYLRSPISRRCCILWQANKNWPNVLRQSFIRGRQSNYIEVPTECGTKMCQPRDTWNVQIGIRLADGSCACYFRFLHQNSHEWSWNDVWKKPTNKNGLHSNRFLMFLCQDLLTSGYLIIHSTSKRLVPRKLRGCFLTFRYWPFIPFPMYHVDVCCILH